jgi:hypothetical protein
VLPVPDPASNVHLLYLEIDRRLHTSIALNFVLNVLSFVERRQAGTFDSTDMYEYIFAAALRLNESVALRWIEPLNRAGGHAGLLVESNCNRPNRHAIAAAE